METDEYVDIPDHIPPVTVSSHKQSLPLVTVPQDAPNPLFSLERGAITKHTIDHNTVPPTEHVEMLFPTNVLKEYVPPAQEEDPKFSVLDHPYVSGKFTVCVLGYGDNYDILFRCVESILAHVPPGRIDLRVALNQPHKQSLRYIEGYVASGVVTKLYVDHGERRKYPAMREMFWDREHPIRTKYVLWFDDDSHVVDSNWLPLLANEIVANHPHGARLYGCKFLHDLKPYQQQGFRAVDWFKAGEWWQNQWLHMIGGQREGPNGHIISFVSGGFWALATETIRKGLIPDIRLNHNGGDITIGEQVHQTGGKIKDFCRGKTPVRWSDAPRRGFREDFPWAKHR